MQGTIASRDSDKVQCWKITRKFIDVVDPNIAYHTVTVQPKIRRSVQSMLPEKARTNAKIRHWSMSS